MHISSDPRKCRHCGSHTSAPKLVDAGPHKGEMRVVCMKCGHIEYQPATPGAQVSPSTGH